MKLDLGCGNKKKEGFIGVDIISMPGVDKVIDLGKYPWPFKDNSIEEIYCSHYIEHTSDLVKFMDEVWRICKNGAKLTFEAPYYTSTFAVQDPTHKRSVSGETFLYFNKKWREDYSIGYYPIKANFNILEMNVVYNPDWAQKPDAEKLYAQKHYINVIDFIIVKMEAVKSSDSVA